MAMTITEAIERLVAELEADEIPQPLAQRFTLGNTLADLLRVAGEDVPAAIAAMVDEALGDRCEPLPVRGSFMDHARQFPERDVADWLPA